MTSPVAAPRTAIDLSRLRGVVERMAHRFFVHASMRPAARALRHRNPEIRRIAAGMLWEWPDPKSVPPLIGALEDPWTGVRGAAARSLGKLGDPAALGPLVRLLADPDRDVSRHARAALDAIDPRWPESEAARASREALFAGLRGGAWGQPELAKLLGASRIDGAAQALVDVLEDERLSHTGYLDLHCAALEALGELGGEEAVRALLRALRQELGGKKGRAAAGALGRLGSPEAVPALAEALRACIEHERWRSALAVAEALGRIGDAAAIAPLIDALTSEQHSLQRAARVALDAVDLEWAGSDVARECTERLVVALARASTREQAAEVLAKSRPDWPQTEEARRAVPAILSAERDAAAAEVLGRIGDPRAIEYLASELASARKDLRDAAAEALERIDARWAETPGAKAAVPALRKAAGGYWVLPAVDALAKIGGTEAVEALVSVLDHPREDGRGAALDALERIDPDWRSSPGARAAEAAIRAREEDAG